jgi:hypothetical protein
MLEGVAAIGGMASPSRLMLLNEEAEVLAAGQRWNGKPV